MKYLTSSDKVKIIKVYLDIDYLVTLINQTYLRKVLPKIKIKKIITPILIRGVDNKIIYINNYI